MSPVCRILKIIYIFLQWFLLNTEKGIKREKKQQHKNGPPQDLGDGPQSADMKNVTKFTLAGISKQLFNQKHENHAA